MLCGGSARFLALAFTSALLLHGDSEALGFDLSDALDDKNDGSSGGGGRPNLKSGERVAKDLRSDSLYERIERFKRGSGKPNQNPKPDSGGLGFDLSDALDHQTTTKRPLKKTDSEALGFDLSDALDDKNDGSNGGGGRPNLKPGERIVDKDLQDILDDGYKPDKGKGDGRYDSSDDPGTGTITETGTIAGIASALAMALIGAVSSYISYQQKKFCFNIQRTGKIAGTTILTQLRGERKQANLLSKGMAQSQWKRVSIQTTSKDKAWKV
ncbi:CD99 antigen-like protein 2 isoform X4 [Trichosurus vulpecula]|uniref:CD99 antigen-like protein 2 isoform X4 n=1 Tax=Trichosurus vulpecula TaxID=9337 RepID=UPI00186AD228|nr:CD99 antigen-like protein 2 isoform X4 [Trichosurus vulpecula]